MKNSVCLGEKNTRFINALFFVQYTKVYNRTSYLASKYDTTTSNKFKEPVPVTALSKA